MAKQKKKKNNNGYFARNVQQNGENFLTRKTPKDIKFDSRFIFKDLAHADVEEDIPKISHYFNNLTFLTNLREVANEEYNTAQAMYIGLQMYTSAAKVGQVIIDPSQQLYENMAIAQNKANAYAIIVTFLNNIISLFNISGDDDWLNYNIDIYLRSLSLQLSKYKRYL